MASTTVTPDAVKAAATAAPLTNRQLGCVLTDIAESASAIERLSIMLTTADDSRDIEAMRTAVNRISQRIGMLADRAADRLPGGIGSVLGGDPEAWMMPPLYFDDQHVVDVGQPN